MEDYLGLLVSISDGLSFPKKNLFLSLRYSKYEVRFPVVSGGDVTTFNQGYFFRNYKVSGHDESDLPVLIELHERKSLFSEKVIADLRVEAFNFYNYDYYEPLCLCLQPKDKNSTYKMQLKIVFQLVKPVAEFVCTAPLDVNQIKPIAYQIEVVSANLDEEMVDKKLFFSLSIDISKGNYVKTRDVKGVQPQWNFRQIIASLDFSNSAEITFHLNSVTHPHQQNSFRLIADAAFSTKQLASSSTFLFKLPFVSRKKTLGVLNVSVKPIYPQSRDGTANIERVFQLQPNVFALPPSALQPASSLYPASSMLPPVADPAADFAPARETPRSPVPPAASPSSASARGVQEEEADIPTPLMRENFTPASRSSTLKSRDGLSQASQRQIRLLEELDQPTLPLKMNSSIRESVLNDFAEGSASKEQSSMDGTLRSYDSRSSFEMSIPAELRQLMREGTAGNGKEIKRKEVKVAKKEPEEVKKDVYVSSCHSIVKKGNAASRGQGLRLAPRFKHDYIEKLTLVLSSVCYKQSTRWVWSPRPAPAGSTARWRRRCPGSSAGSRRGPPPPPPPSPPASGSSPPPGGTAARSPAASSCRSGGSSPAGSPSPAASAAAPTSPP